MHLQMFQHDRGAKKLCARASESMNEQISDEIPHFSNIVYFLKSTVFYTITASRYRNKRQDGTFLRAERKLKPIKQTIDTQKKIR